jgi:hypothetical protein
MLKAVWSPMGTLLAAVFLAGCMGSHKEVGSKPVCGQLPGFESVAAADVVVFGDAHGTVEPPQIFATAACRFSSGLNGERGVVGLELPDRFNQYFADLAPDKLAASIAALEADAFWDAMQDGRHSLSMLTMVRQLMAISAESDGYLKLVAFERRKVDEMGAQFFVERMRAYSAKKGLVFIGNAHARIVPMRGRNVVPFAKRLQDAGLEVISLDIRAGGGKGWLCSDSCREVPFPSFEGGDAAKIVVEPCAGECAYHGYYYIPALSVSQPVRGNR